MNNTIRFLIGLILLPLSLIFIAFTAVLLFPVLLASLALFFTIVAIVIFIGVFVFIYYITRKEPTKKQTKHSNNYSIKSGKRK